MQEVWGSGCPRNQHSGGPCGAWTRMPSMTWRAPGRSTPRCRGRSSGGSSRWMARPYAARLAAGPPVITCWPPSIMLTAPSQARWKFGAKTNEVRREALCRIPNSVRRNSGESSWTRWLTRIRKVKGTRACHDRLRLRPKTRGSAQGSPRDMAKARLPEPQSPAMQIFIRRKWSLKPAPRSASCYLVGDATPGAAGDAQ